MELVVPPPTDDHDRVFIAAAELFGVLSAPMRLRIISVVCEFERSAGDILSEVGGTQSNLSQHLSVLYRAGVLSRRKAGTTVYYRVHNEHVAHLCRNVCTQFASSLEP